MTATDLVRMWKDPDVEDRTDHPAGAIDLAVGAAAEAPATEYMKTLGCCNGYTNKTCKCDAEVSAF